jgi:hypothetical protein
MSSLIRNIENKVFNTRILRKPKPAITADPNIEDIENVPIEYLDVKLIVMSRETHMEVMRQDYSGTYVSYPYDKTGPYRMFGIRVAFDDSLPFGEVLVAGDVV